MHGRKPRPLGADTEIANRIHEDIEWSPFILPQDVMVSVVNGKATLTGTVRTDRKRCAAADCPVEAAAATIDNELKVI